MQLDDYFVSESLATEFGPVERIRIKGHRIAIEHVIEFYKEGVSPEAILRDIYPTLSLEKIYATILYYLANKRRIDGYLRRGDAIAAKFYRKQAQKGPSAIEKKIHALKRRSQQTVPKV